MNPFHCHLVSATVLLAVSSPCQVWAADAVAAAGFDLSDMAFQARALNGPRDSGSLYWFEGTAPTHWASSEPYSAPPGGFLYVTGSGNGQTDPEFTVLPTSVWPQASLNTSSNALGHVQLSITPTSISTHVSLDANDMAQAAQLAAAKQSAGAGTYLASSLDNPWRVVLAPHTELTWSGTVSQFISQDSQALQDALTPHYRPDLSMNAWVASYFALSLQADEGLTFGPGSHEANGYLDGGLGGYAPGYLTDIPERQDLPSRSFAITLINPTDQALGAAYSFEFSVGVGTEIRLSGAIDPVTPAVPEPSTYALMGLGLVGLAAVTRRRHAQA